MITNVKRLGVYSSDNEFQQKFIVHFPLRKNDEVNCQYWHQFLLLVSCLDWMHNVGYPMLFEKLAEFKRLIGFL